MEITERKFPWKRNAEKERPFEKSSRKTSALPSFPAAISEGLEQFRDKVKMVFAQGVSALDTQGEFKRKKAERRFGAVKFFSNFFGRSGAAAADFWRHWE